MTTITQTHYPTLEIDTREPDCLIIISQEKLEPQIVFIEREKIPELIELLKTQIK